MNQSPPDHRGRARILLLFLLLSLAPACNRENPRLLPQHLAGFWTTDDGRYQGRFLELYTAFVIVGTGANDPPQVQLIDRVRAQPVGVETAYTISSEDTFGGKYEMTIRFDPAGGGIIHFPNSNAAWTRHRDDGASRKP